MLRWSRVIVHTHWIGQQLDMGGKGYQLAVDVAANQVGCADMIAVVKNVPGKLIKRQFLIVNMDGQVLQIPSKMDYYEIVMRLRTRVE